jgi:hypothetical protein
MSELRWQKSSFSEGGTENCVELAADLSGVRRHLRESDEPGVVVTTSRRALADFLHAVKSGRFDRLGG